VAVTADHAAPGPADALLAHRVESPTGDAVADIHRAVPGLRPATSGLIRAATYDPPPARGPVVEEIVTVDSPPLLTGEQTPARRRRFMLVNACTLASLLLGMGAIFLAMQGQVTEAAVVLIACVAFDGIDGALARAFGVSTPFGAQMDSLADMCSFGIATPVVAYAWLTGSTPALVVAPICALVGICAAIRLARFNVSPKNGYYFCGVPTTMAAAIIVASMLILPHPGPGLVASAVAALALLMVSTFPYMKIGQLRRVPPWLFLVGAVAAVIDAPTTFTLGIGAYLLSGPLLWAKQRRAIEA
jgi:CDP-diacylglycerol--serine O-phosphatidyltransferase